MSKSISCGSSGDSRNKARIKGRNGDGGGHLNHIWGGGLASCCTSTSTTSWPGIAVGLAGGTGGRTVKKRLAPDTWWGNWELGSQFNCVDWHKFMYLYGRNTHSYPHTPSYNAHIRSAHKHTHTTSHTTTPQLQTITATHTTTNHRHHTHLP